MASLVTLGGEGVQKGRLSLGLRGAGWADITVATDTAPTVGQRLTLEVDGGLSWSGTVRSVGVYLLNTEVRLVGGAGGLSAPVVGAFQGAILGDVLTEILRASGETQAEIASDVLSVPLDRWTLGQCTAARALDELADAASIYLGVSIAWRMLPAGTLWMGAETWPAEALPGDHVISKQWPDEGRTLLGCASPFVLPGVDLETVGKIAGVDHYFDPDRMRSECWAAEHLDPIDKMAAAVLERLGLNYTGAPRIDRLLLARARVDAVGSGTVDVTPESGRLSPMQKVPLRQTAAKATVKTGAHVLLAWEGGTSGGVVALPTWDDGATFSQVDVLADLVNLGATSGAQYVALANKVDSALGSLKSAIQGWTPVANDGGAALKTALTTLFTGPPTWPQSTAAAQVKAK